MTIKLSDVQVGETVWVDRWATSGGIFTKRAAKDVEGSLDCYHRETAEPIRGGAGGKWGEWGDVDAELPDLYYSEDTIYAHFDKKPNRRGGNTIDLGSRTRCTLPTSQRLTLKQVPTGRWVQVVHHAVVVSGTLGRLGDSEFVTVGNTLVPRFLVVQRLADPSLERRHVKVPEFKLTVNNPGDPTPLRGVAPGTVLRGGTTGKLYTVTTRRDETSVSVMEPTGVLRPYPAGETLANLNLIATEPKDPVLPKVGDLITYKGSLYWVRDTSSAPTLRLERVFPRHDGPWTCTDGSPYHVVRLREVIVDTV